ncbi:Transcription factor GLABRA 3 [Platanthera guangdongensis]|uniref:Transcription factor GLABRA 3 n=1 Tax=Platanthera guangdongensis TaxID=2320717 RepID=A0ABR2LRK4_9ASPA
MAVEMQSQEEVQRHLFRKQLAACLRSIQWSYAIFWSTSSSHERLLEWDDGYYNGDIKTRKATQQTECKADQMGLQRSEQLRELYESLCAGDCNQQSRRPSASLSPEDLTDPEWYYLVCMSFTFKFGQDLPGKVYELKEPIWLNNAQFAENKSFCRSLLAKSALIQTVVCLPFMDGVLELGTTDLVLEDSAFVHNIASSFWEFQIPVCSEHSTSSSPLVAREEENGCLILDHEADDTIMLQNHALITENDSSIFQFSDNPYTSNKESEPIHEMSTKNHPCRSKEMVGNPEDFSNEDRSKIRRPIDDKFSNGLHVSVNFSESLSSPFGQNILSPMGERVGSTMFDNLQQDGHADFRFLGVDGDGSHYSCTLSTVLGNLKHGVSSPGLLTFQNVSDESSFRAWRAGAKASKNFTKTPQRMLKKILFQSVWMSGGQQVKPREENLLKNKAFRTEGDDTNVNHVLSERRRREKLNEKFLILRSLIPSISKIDKASILTDTIEYLKELERRVEELESCREAGDPDHDTRERRKYPDIAERTSDNYGNEGLFGCHNPSTNKRKACQIYDAEAEHQLLLSKNALVDINVTMIENEVLVELQCPWRDFLLLEIVEAMSNLHLDAHSVQSSTADSTLAITLRAKVMSTVIASPGMIKKALQRVVARC